MDTSELDRLNALLDRDVELREVGLPFPKVMKIL